MFSFARVRIGVQAVVISTCKSKSFTSIVIWVVKLSCVHFWTLVVLFTTVHTCCFVFLYTFVRPGPKSRKLIPQLFWFSNQTPYFICNPCLPVSIVQVASFRSLQWLCALLQIASKVTWLAGFCLHARLTVMVRPGFSENIIL